LTGGTSTRRLTSWAWTGEPYWMGAWVVVGAVEVAGVDVVGVLLTVVVIDDGSPVPESGTCWVPGSALSVNVRVAVTSPAAVGVNSTVTAHDAPAVRICPPHVSTAIANADAPTSVGADVTLSGPGPLFRSSTPPRWVLPIEVGANGIVLGSTAAAGGLPPCWELVVWLVFEERDVVVLE
jgi:hypothetical protein